MDNTELKRYVQQATLCLPIYTYHVGRLVRGVGLVDSEERQAIRRRPTSIFTLHESVLHDDKGFTVEPSRTLRIIQDLSIGDVLVGAAKIMSGEVVTVVGADEGITAGGRQFFAIALLIGFLECTESMNVEGGVASHSVEL